MKCAASISFVLCTAVAVALVAAGSAAASVGVNCVKPFDFTTKYQDLHNCKMNGVTIAGSDSPGDAMQGSNLTGASLNGATIGTDSANLTLRTARDLHSRRRLPNTLSRGQAKHRRFVWNFGIEHINRKNHVKEVIAENDQTSRSRSGGEAAGECLSSAAIRT